MGADEDSSALGADEDSVFLLFAKRHSDCGSSGGKAKSAAVATGRSSWTRAIHQDGQDNRSHLEMYPALKKRPSSQQCMSASDLGALGQFLQPKFPKPSQAMAERRSLSWEESIHRLGPTSRWNSGDRVFEL